ncbi:ornithine carbamoyltransferase, partial [candidate division KSB1 bacterium]|nr:ornithine carbamoyltransferase [candidate division KSB1 bacterium]
MVFQKPSTRTRVSFETGMYQLGGHALYLSPAEIGLGTRESVPDVARVLAGFNDAIMARVFGHEIVTQLAKYASVPVINGLSDLLHPCQIIGDIFTILEFKGRVEDVKIAYVGDGNNVAHSWINLAGRLKISLRIATPEGYEPDAGITQWARHQKKGEIIITNEPRQAVSGADVIYTDVWASMGQEAEAESRKKIFQDFQVNRQLVSLADPSCIVMHCLPAHRGEEITDEVMESPGSVVFVEAENRMHAQKAILVKLIKN